MNTNDRRRRMMLDHVDRASSRQVGALEKTILRSRSLEGREVLAFEASRGESDVEGLVEAARSGSSAPVADPEALARLARVLAKSQIRSDDLADSVALYSQVERQSCDVLDPDHASTYVQALFSLGRWDDVADRLDRFELSGARGEQLRVDLTNPVVTGDDWDAWLPRFRDLMGLTDAGFEPLSLDGGHGAPLDRLVSVPSTKCSGPLVTVATSTYRPGPELLVAVRSLIRQTWRDLELLVVDDGSGPDYDDMLRRVEALDDRVRVIRLPANGGTYRARNVALELALGDFFTVHDSDDWAHPRRIEASIRPLLDDPSLKATKGYCIRANSHLVINEVGKSPFMPFAPSLMIRKRPVVAAIGYYDTARKGADTEYEQRLGLACGHVQMLTRRPALTIRRLVDGGSLSQEEFRPGWKHPARFAYQSAYRRWHDEIRQGASPTLRPGGRTAAFRAPWSFQPVKSESLRYDVVYVSDWRQLAAPQFSMLAEIDALRSEGRTVAICHMESYRFMSAGDPRLHPAVQRRVEDGDFDHVTLPDPVRADLVVVRYPPVLQFPPSDPKCAWTVRHLWVVANQAPSELDGSDRRYIVDDCTEHARRIFGVDPLWVPQGPVARQSVEQEMIGRDRQGLAAFDDPAILRVEEWAAEHRPWEHECVRIGRYSRDHPMKFPPDSDLLSKVYVADADVEVRMMGAVKVVSALAGDDIPSNWTLLPYKTMHVRDFLATIDFFVYYDHPDSNEAFGRSMLEAMAAGVVVILDPKYEPVFGPAAIYAQPEDAAAVARAMRADPDAYRRQIAVAHEVVEREFSPAAFLRRVGPYLAPVEAATGAVAAASFESFEFLITDGVFSPPDGIAPIHETQRTPGPLSIMTGPGGAVGRCTLLDDRPQRPPVHVVTVGVDSSEGTPGRLADAFRLGGVPGLEERMVLERRPILVVVHDGRFIHVLSDMECHVAWSLTQRGFVLGNSHLIAAVGVARGRPSEPSVGRRTMPMTSARRAARLLAPRHRLSVDGYGRTATQVPITERRESSDGPA